MVLKIRSIPREGLDLSFSISPKEICRDLTKKDEAFDIFDKEIVCVLRAEQIKRDVFLSGEASTTIHPVCSRCGENFDKKLAIPVALTCSPEQVPQGADFHQESDEGVVYYRKEELDLSQIMREQLLLSLPIQYVCRANCLGLCPICGGNLNSGDHRCKLTA